MFSRTPTPRASPRSRRMWILALLALLSGPSSAAADSPLDSLAEKWRWRIFGRDEGVSPGAISVIYQDVDDKIYAATERGLCRYDLHHWEIIENADPFEDGRVERIVESLNTVYCATARVLWAEDGGRRLRRIYPPRRAVSGRIFLAASRLGEVFMIDEALRAHYRVRDGVEPMDSGVELPGGRIRAYEIDEDGRHWLATDMGLYYRELWIRSWRPLVERDFPFPESECLRFLSFQVPSQTPLPRTQRLAKGRELWALFGTRDEKRRWLLARLGDEGHWSPVSSDSFDSPVESVTSDTVGNHYATLDDGRLYFLEAKGDAWQRVETLGPGTMKLYGCLLDSRGNLWFRLGAGGLAFVNLQSRRWLRFPGLSGPPYPRVLSLLETSGGELWAGTETGCVRYPRGISTTERSAGADEDPTEEDVIVYRRRADVDLRMVTALGEDSLGRIWVGSEIFSGVFRFSPEDGYWSARVSSDEPIHRIVADFREELWFLPAEVTGDEPRLYRVSPFTSNEFRSVSIVSSALDGIRPDELVVNDLVRTQADVFWLATEVGLLECELEEDEIRGPRLVVGRRLTEDDGLMSSRVWDVEEGADGSIWVCYPSSGSGVTQIDGSRLAYHDVQDGLASPEVWTIVRSGRDLWFGTAAGLSRYDGECFYSFPVASADPHSSLVFAVLSPRGRQRQGVLVVGTEEHGCLRYQSDDSRRPRFAWLDFPASVGGDRPATFAWRARDYKNDTLPEDLIFRYRLDGGEWQDISSRSTVTLEEALPAGRHTFELEVRDLDGNRNRESVAHVFTVAPSRFSWAMAAAGLLFGTLLLAGFAYWRRRHRAERRFLGLCRDFYLDHPAAVFVLDQEGRVRDYNQRLRDVLGLGDTRPEDVVGRPLRMVPALAPLGLGPRIEDALRGRSFRVRGTSFVEGARAPDEGSERLLEVRGFPLGPSFRATTRSAGPDFRHASGASRGVTVVVEDLTREAEEERIVSRDRRLQGMKELAERLSGDLSQLVEILDRLRDGAGGPRDRRFAERIERAEAVLRGLLDFSRPREEAPPAEVVDLDPVVESLLGFSDNGTGGAALAFGRHVRVDYRAQTGLWPVRADPEAIAGALRAVLENASEALAERGELVVRASNLRLEGDPGALPEGSYVEVIVRDDGPGIDPARLETVFDPLYTTKPSPRAAGMGLSVAYGLVRMSGGDIRLHSRPGAGTAVRILLPAAR